MMLFLLGSLLASPLFAASTAEPEVVVAVIDTGMDLRHPLLRGHLWKNPGESGLDAQGRDKATNGIDDDGNGYIDDVSGWNFAGDNADVRDLHGHGTHVAGIIQSLAPKARLMVLKFYDAKASGQDNMDATVKAINYAVQMKARIINYSGGGTSKYAPEEEALRRAQAQGLLVVAAAGNESSNSDVKGFYPAGYGLANILSIAAVDENRRLLPTSNFGKNSVDIAAPGKNIVSTLPEGLRGPMTGTSQATAFVSGAAALLMASHPEFKDPEKLIWQLTHTGDEEEGLIGKTKFQSTLSAHRALTMKDRDLGAFGDVDFNSDPRSLWQDSDGADKEEDPGQDELPFKLARLKTRNLKP